MPKLILNIPDFRDDTWSTPITILEVDLIKDVYNDKDKINFSLNGKSYSTNVPYIYED